jgi:GNAT superfamily N-acetyltransferase
MASYRFCRPDDIPLLVAAVNRCFDVHFPQQQPFSVDQLRREMRQLQLWPSNSMVATAGSEPVAVVIGTKRAREVLVRRIGVAPGHQRQGHGRHLLGSLRQKMAVLGPPRLIAEVPAALSGAGDFFVATGWQVETELVDYLRTAPQRAVPAELLATLTVAELDAAGLLPARTDLPWERQVESLRASGDALAGAGLLGAEGWEAWALYRRTGGDTEVVLLGTAAPVPAGGAPAAVTARFDAAAEARLALLCDGLQASRPGPLRLVHCLADEVPAAVLARLGFAPRATTVRYVMEALAA